MKTMLIDIDGYLNVSYLKELQRYYRRFPFSRDYDNAGDLHLRLLKDYTIINKGRSHHCLTTIDCHYRVILFY